jgi:hypothetical protein
MNETTCYVFAFGFLIEAAVLAWNTVTLERLRRQVWKLRQEIKNRPPSAQKPRLDFNIGPVSNRNL